MKTKASILFLLLAFFTNVAAWGQQKAKAADILDKTAASFKKGNGILITFGGSQKGTLQLQGNKYHLTCGGIETWFDGKTQWSYVAKNEEVTISTPTSEEIQESNPYSLFSSYKTNFNYAYKGQKTVQGKKVHEIELTPRGNRNGITRITVYITAAYVPQSIVLKLSGGHAQTFNITSYQSGKTYTAATFRFDSKKYPKAEVIDLR